MSDLFAVSLVAMEICPVAPGNAQKYVDQITGYVLWGVGVLFLVAVMVSIGAIVAGRLFSMPHASKVGVISIVVVFFCAIAYMVLPGLVDSLMGSGCIGGGGSQPSAKATEVTSGISQVGGWGRRRLLMILAAVVLMILSLVFGLIMVAHHAATPVWRADDTGGEPAVTDRQQRPGSVSRDAIAAEPMLEVQPADSRPTAPAAIAGPVIEIPPSTVVGPAGVPAGFPHTAEGAVGQLAAIEVTVLQGMSIPHTNDVYRRWALPGGVGVDRWQMTANVQAFLAAPQMSDEKDLSASVVAAPAAGQIKGVDGPDWLVACVLLKVRATITVEARMGYGYCERMQWQSGRWMLAPGTPPAKAPSTWPGSELSIKAGWRSWIDAGEG